LPHGFRLLGIDSRDEHATVMLEDPRRNKGDLFRRFTLAEDDLWGAHTEVTMVIDASHTEIFERQRRNGPNSLFRGHRPTAHLVQKRSKSLGIHTDKGLVHITRSVDPLVFE
jgi:hypothetical protein